MDNEGVGALQKIMIRCTVAVIDFSTRLIWILPLSPVPLLRPSYQNMLNRRAFSEVLYDAPKASKLKEDARQVEFVRIGQALKLEAIVRGDAPTSLASTVPSSVFKRPPWEPHCFYANFLHRGNIVGDSWGKDALFIATDDGTFLIRGEWNRE